MKNINKWINNYIKDVNLDNIEWVVLNSNEMNNFFKNNYFDMSVWEYVYDENSNFLYPTPLGMHYLNYDNPSNNKEYSFLLGIVDNNIEKKTIVAATMYLDKYFMFSDQKHPATYISTMEVNSYFRNRGLYKKMCEALINFINREQHIIITKQSDMGKQYNVLENFKKCLISKGFKNYILEDNNGLINSELHDIICINQKVLKKTN